MAATFAGQLQTMDDDYGQSHVYRIEAVSAGFDHHFLVPKMYFECICSRLDMQRVSADLLSVFSLNAANGELAVGAKELLDYEAISAYTIQIVSTDSGTPPYSLSGTVTVNVLDVNEAPSNVTLSGNEVYLLQYAKRRG